MSPPQGNASDPLETGKPYSVKKAQPREVPVSIRGTAQTTRSVSAIIRE
jgi:hypothetical protein